MSKLPQISGPDVVRALQKLGFTVRRQHGSHIIMRRDDPFAQTVVPDHQQIDRGTLRAILRQTEITADELIKRL
jgi:predicted RNA binding protein YcfA (HicA-like mRNA interferase family)